MKQETIIQSTKCTNLDWHPSDVAGRLVDDAPYVKLTEDQVWISLKRTFMYFPWFFILPPPLLKSSQIFTFDGQMVIFFIIENIQIHHCICLLLVLPF